MIIVFYDGKCGLCNREIRHYQKIAPQGIFEWCDITNTPERLDDFNISLVDAFKILHTVDSQGNIHRGVKSSILIWKHLKRWKVLACIIQFPPIFIITHTAYTIFAKWRFKRLSYCKTP